MQQIEVWHMTHTGKYARLFYFKYLHKKTKKLKFS